MSKIKKIYNFKSKEDFNKVSNTLKRPCCYSIQGKPNTFAFLRGNVEVIGRLIMDNERFTIVIDNPILIEGEKYTLWYCDLNGKKYGKYDMIDSFSDYVNDDCILPFINFNIIPSEVDAIGIYDSTDKLVGIVSILIDKEEKEMPLFKVGILSDIHDDMNDFDYSRLPKTYPPADEAQSDMARALQYFKQIEKVDLVCSCGDLTQQDGGQSAISASEEFTLASQIIHEILGQEIPFYTCSGNHDMRDFDERMSFFTDYAWNKVSDKVTNFVSVKSNDSIEDRRETEFSFDVEKNGKTYHFIFLSLWEDSNEAYHTNVINDYLGQELEANKDKITFLFTHCFFGDYNYTTNFAGDFKRLYKYGGGWTIFSGGKSSTASKNAKNAKILEYLSNYPNLFVFGGHSHWKYELQKYEETANISCYKDAATLVHVGACGAPRDWLGTTTNSAADQIYRPLESQGLLMEVYTNKIVLKGINFNAKVSHIYDEFESNTDTLQELYMQHIGETGKYHMRTIKYIPCSIYKIEK